MKHLLGILVLVAVPALKSVAAQSPVVPEPSAQSTSEVAHPQPTPNRATSHDRHMRKHRSGARRHHHRTTSKNTPN